MRGRSGATPPKTGARTARTERRYVHRLDQISFPTGRTAMSEIEMGPIDYILVEWPGRQPNGEVAPHLVDLVDRGLIRILDLAFVAKDEDGTVSGLELSDLG